MPPTEGIDALVDDIEQALRDQGSGLARVRIIASLIDRLQPLLGDAVDRARAEGRSWEEIGAALGVSRQAVHQKFAKKPRV